MKKMKPIQLEDDIALWLKELLEGLLLTANRDNWPIEMQQKLNAQLVIGKIIEARE
jgi:hypothetical protein